MNLLVTATEIKTALIHNPNFDTTVIKDEYIIRAQKDHLQPLIGEDLFNLIVITPASYSALISGETYTKSNGRQVLYEGIKMFLAYATLYEAIPHIYMQLGKAGVFKNNVENSDRITIDEMEMLRNLYLNRANIESNFILTYLIDNINTYQYFNGNTKEDSNKFYGGILL